MGIVFFCQSCGARFEVDFGLVIQDKLAVFERAPEPRLERSALRDALADLRREENQPLARAARTLKCSFGILQQRFGVARIMRKERDAALRDDVDLIVPNSK